MHRSGTSMVASLLRRAGLHLGPESNFVPPSPRNPAGYFEYKKLVELNDELLTKLGGSYLNPPAFAREDVAEVRGLREKAAAILREFEGREPWGWKDPRNSLTLPFWASLVRGVKIVICLRHPWDVARSLHRSSYLPDYTLRDIAGFIYRGESVPDYALSVILWNMYPRLPVAHARYRRRLLSHPAGLKLLKGVSQLQVLLSARQREAYTHLFGLALWMIYNERLLKFTTPEERIITHYDAYFEDPRAELRRVLDFLRLEVSDEEVERCCSTISKELRHNQAHSDRASGARVSAEVLGLYERMCEEAGFKPSTRAGRSR